jgi:hypothetical protein
VKHLLRQADSTSPIGTIAVGTAKDNRDSPLVPFCFIRFG